MHYFTNLPLRYLAATPYYADFFLQRGLCPELGLDAESIQDLSWEWHKKTAALFRQHGLACTIHLPFFDLHPGSPDSMELSAARATLEQAAHLATLYTPRAMIGHPAYNQKSPPLCREWVRRSTETWQRVQAYAKGTPLRLENTHELTPEPIAALVENLSGHGQDVGICFDIGHWFSFGRGSSKNNLAHWLDAFGKYIKHLHLHDNDGSNDQHLGLGSANIPLEAVFSGLEQRGVHATATLEPHTVHDYALSKAFVSGHTHAATLLRRITS